MTDRMGGGHDAAHDYPAMTVESSHAQIDAGFSPARVRKGLRKRKNWEQLVKFCLVGATGYAVNLWVFSFLVLVLDVHYIPAAIGSFLVAVTNNYAWNRLWTFRDQRGSVAYQGMRFFVVSLVALAANLAVLELLIQSGLSEVVAQAIAILLVTPVNFVGNKLWSFGTPTLIAVAALAALSLVLPSTGAAQSDPSDLARLDRERGDRARARGLEGRALARPLPAGPHDVGRLQGRLANVGGQGVVGRGGADRGRGGRGHDGAGRRGVDRAAGRLEDGARGRGVVRRQDPPEALRLGRVLPPLPSRSREPPSAALDAEPRSARAPRVHGLARVLRPRRDLPQRPARLPRARCTCSVVGYGSASAGADRRSRPSGRPGSSLRRLCSCSGFASG